VDRSAAYAARWVAKNIVAADLARRCEVQVAYAIGVASPVSVYVNSFGTGRVADSVLERAVREVFDLRPARLIKDLKLRQPIYSATAAYGHFGRTPVKAEYAEAGQKIQRVEMFTWERTNRTRELKDATKA